MVITTLQEAVQQMLLTKQRVQGMKQAVDYRIEMSGYSTGVDQIVEVMDKWQAVLEYLIAQEMDRQGDL